MTMLEINLRPSQRTLRSFGFIALAGFGLLGGLIYWRRGLFGLDFAGASTPAAYALWMLGLVSAVLSVIAPGANRPLYAGLILVTYPIGYLLSHVLMAAVFYGVITPVGLVFRIIGRDSLHRRFDRHRPSYWVPHHPPATVERYFRQF